MLSVDRIHSSIKAFDIQELLDMQFTIDRTIRDMVISFINGLHKNLGIDIPVIKYGHISLHGYSVQIGLTIGDRPETFVHVHRDAINDKDSIQYIEVLEKCSEGKKKLMMDYNKDEIDKFISLAKKYNVLLNGFPRVIYITDLLS